MIREDRYGLLTSSTETEAIHALEEAVHGVGAHRPNAATALGRAISLDPDHVAAHALKGFACLILARKELVPDAAQALKDARSAPPPPGWRDA